MPWEQKEEAMTLLRSIQREWVTPVKRVWMAYTTTPRDSVPTCR